MSTYLRRFIVLVSVTCFGNSVMLSHTQGPTLMDEPPSKVEFSNTTGTVLTCIARGSPQPEIRWLDVVGQELQHIPRLREVLNNGSLYFPPFNAGEYNPDIHSTTYRCEAHNSAGRVLSKYIRLKAVVSQPYQIQVEDVFVLKDNVAVFKCNAPSYIRPYLVVISWQTENPTLGKTTLQPSRRYTMTSHGTLHIWDVKTVDSYITYHCLTINRLTGERTLSLPGKLIVKTPEEQSAPRMLYTVPTVTARVGFPTDLICVARGHPPPVYRWYKLNHGLHGSLLEMDTQQSALHFSSVQPENAGKYVCVVSNQIGDDRREITLAVYSPLNVEVRPLRQVVDADASARLNCSITGGTESRRVFWVKDGNVLHESGTVLYIQRVRRHNRGMYQCVVRDADDSAQGTAELVLGAYPPVFLWKFIEQTIQPGPPVSLRCVASGHPPPRITWYHDDVEITPSGGYVLGSYLDLAGDVVSYVNISSTRVYHGGVYNCVAANIMGSVTHSNGLNIYGPPTSREHRNITLVSGAFIVLLCPVAGFPIVNVTWKKSGDTLPVNARQKTYDNGALMLEGVDSITDSGEYLCTVRNPQGLTAQGKVYVNIMKPPKILPFQFPSNIEENMRIQLPCNIISGDFPITITWSKDGAPLPRDETVQELPSEIANNLQFKSVAARHSGNYTCTARNSAATDNYTATLIVSVAPKWVVEPQDTFALYHHPVFLHCQATGYPTPHIVWMKQKSEPSTGYVQLEFGPQYITYQNGTLAMHSVELSDEGRYNCQAFNGIGTPLTKMIFLKVNVPAHFRSHVVNQSGIAGEPVILVCEAQGDAPLRVSWTAAKWPLAPSRTRIVERRTPGGLAAELHIDQLTRKDAGRYHCMASNDYGQDEMDVYLIVKEPPEAPHNVAVQQVGGRYVIVGWTPPYSLPTSYIIQHREDWSNSPWNNETEPGDIRAARFRALSPNSDYSFRIIAVNEVGPSPPSKVVHAHTLQEAPSGAPVYISAVGSSSTSILVKWKPPHKSLTHGPILGYHVEYQLPGVGPPRTQIVKGNKLETTITGLLPNTRYNIAVKAFNSMGDGPLSPIVYVPTRQGVPDMPPQNVRCSITSAQSLHIHWDPPPQEHVYGELKGYKVFYKFINPGIEHSNKVEMKKTSRQELLITGLMVYGNYSIRVLGYTMEGDGVKSEIMFCTTREDVPCPLSQIKALPMTDTSIVVAWARPAEPNGKITKYYIYSRSLQPNSSKKIRRDTVHGDDDLTFELRNLEVNHQYEFWASAVTSAGEGALSGTVTQSPTSKVPARIAGYSQIVYGIFNEDITLQCKGVGITPRISYTWRGPNLNTGITSNDETHRNLELNKLNKEHAGNYTCCVENAYGKDEITYSLIVKLPPGAPVVSVTDSTTHSLLLNWHVPNNGGAYITGYILKYKKVSSEWLEITIDTEENTYKLDGLKCGSRYQLYLIACNLIGDGAPSTNVIGITKGTVPEVPVDDTLIQTNTTSFLLFLDSWPDNGCPIHYFVVEYKFQADNEWILVSNNAQAEQLLIQPLIPATSYVIKVTAYNDAGSNYREFLVSTRSVTGEMIILNSSKSGDDEDENSLTTQLNYIIPIITAILFSISAIICVLVLFMRKQSPRAIPQQCNDKTLAEIENQRNSDQQEGKRDSSLSGQKGSDNSAKDDEISPYATFSYPGFAVAPSTQSMDYSMQFSTFSQKECYAGRPGTSLQSREHKPGYRSKDIEMTCTSKSPPDGLSLEISCISSQQSLGKSSARHLGLRPRSKSTCAKHSQYDTDSSGEDTKHKGQYRKPSRCGSMFEPGSSTESIEASPELRCKVQRVKLSRRSATSRQQQMVTLQPPRAFSDEQPECDRISGVFLMTEQDLMSEQVTRLLKRYKQRQDKENGEYTIRV